MDLNKSHQQLKKIKFFIREKGLQSQFKLIKVNITYLQRTQLTRDIMSVTIAIAMENNGVDDIDLIVQL